MTWLSENPMWEAFGSRALFWAGSQLLHFTAEEGAGGHCEGEARSLYDRRAFDWLDERLRPDVDQ